LIGSRYRSKIEILKMTLTSMDIAEDHNVFNILKVNIFYNYVQS
jgi:hypothetical protein